MTASSDAREAAGVVRCPTCGKRNRVPAVASGAPRCANCKAPLPWVVDAGDDRFSAVADESSLPVLVDLWAPWCGPCRMVSPVLEQLATDMAGRIKLVKVNADIAPQVSRRFEAQALREGSLALGWEVVELSEECARPSSGRTKPNVLPRPNSDSTQIWPPMPSTIKRQM